jgi:hypothetical protein
MKNIRIIPLIISLALIAACSKHEQPFNLVGCMDHWQELTPEQQQVCRVKGEPTEAEKAANPTYQFLHDPTGEWAKAFAEQQQRTRENAWRTENPEDLRMDREQNK